VADLEESSGETTVLNRLHCWLHTFAKLPCNPQYRSSLYQL
jgi:hypothetical protein